MLHAIRWSYRFYNIIILRGGRKVYIGVYLIGIIGDNMAAKKPYDEKFVDLLVKNGIKPKIARTLAYLKGKEEVKSIEIERDTGLRQPEVSIAIQFLRKKGWVKKRDIKKQGKGRPVHGYRLAHPLSTIVSEIEKDRRKIIDQLEKDLNDLKKYV